MTLEIPAKQRVVQMMTTILTDNILDRADFARSRGAAILGTLESEPTAAKAGAALNAKESWISISHWMNTKARHSYCLDGDA